MILGTDFTAMNFVGIIWVIWTREGTRKMVRANGSTVIELPDSAAGVPLVLAHSMKTMTGRQPYSSIGIHTTHDRLDEHLNGHWFPPQKP